jgi:hypothetical protein
MDTVSTKPAKAKTGPAKGCKYGDRQKTARVEIPIEPDVLEKIRRAAEQDGVSVARWFRTLASNALADKEA